MSKGNRVKSPQHGSQPANGSNHFATLLWTSLIAAAFIAVTHLGLAMQADLQRWVNKISPSYSSLLTDPQVIYSIWLGFLGVHGAVGAVAPILGYTLLATTITSASRVAPSGAVIAEEIGWLSYLTTSLALLAGSLVAIMSAPSALGLALAGLSTIYVVVRTMLVFARGFELMERPEKFDAGARNYLTKAIAGLPASPLDQALKSELGDLNADLAPLRNPFKSGRATAVLRFGDSMQATQLLSVSRGAVSQLISEARKLDLEVHLNSGDCPEFIPRGGLALFQVSALSAQVSSNSNERPSTARDADVDQVKLARLQSVASRVIVYGRGSWIDDMSRAPMLVQRHVATVIYEAIPNHRPHDLEYGLEVLGDVIDSLGDRALSAGGAERLNVHQWVVDVPRFVIGQIESGIGLKWNYAQSTAAFLRARLLKWFGDPKFDSLSRRYIEMIAQIFSVVTLDQIKVAESLAPMVRELTYLDRLGRGEVVVFVQRPLILMLVGGHLRHELDGPSRHLIMKTIVGVLRYSRAERQGDLYAETFAGAVAVAIYSARDRRWCTELVAEIIAMYEKKVHADIPVDAILSIAENPEDVDRRWNWSWWEMEQKESGEAHMIEMSGLLVMASMLLLSSKVLELHQLQNEHIPAEHVLERMIRKIEAKHWFEYIGDSQIARLQRLIQPLRNLLDRRRFILAEIVAQSEIDSDKAQEYVERELQAVKTELGDYCEWIASVDVVEAVERAAPEGQYGASSLMPREGFTPVFTDTYKKADPGHEECSCQSVESSVPSSSVVRLSRPASPASAVPRWPGSWGFATPC